MLYGSAKFARLQHCVQLLFIDNFRSPKRYMFKNKSTKNIISRQNMIITKNIYRTFLGSGAINS